MATHALMNTYGDRSITLIKGEGMYLWDDHGKRYLDALSGIAVCGLGHAHPDFVDTVCDQVKNLVHVSNLYNIEPQQQLADQICAVAGMDKAFFSNSGAEANEAAIKIARKYGNDKGISNPLVITTKGSFHGRTMATLTATGNPKVKKGFEPLVPGFIHVPYNDVETIETLTKVHPNIVAILVEPIQGEGGINMPAPDYLTRLRALCDQQEWLLMLDEIQTGNGRTGQFFAYQHTNILPDVVTTAKGLGNGLPIGACLARGKAAEVFQPGNHGSTFGGNPLACRAAESVIEILLKDKLIENAAEKGQYIIETLKQKLASNKHLVEVRGKGLMIGVQLDQDCPELVKVAADKGLLLNVTAGSTVRLLPPLILNQQDADNICDLVVETINTLA